jgi:nucleotide-binding universal stress UspA family protein
MGYKRILVPVDGGATSAGGLLEAIKLAHDGRAKLLLLHVVEEYAILGLPEAGASIGPVLDALKSAGRRTLAKIERSARRLGVRPETKLIEDFSGRVANAIVDEAKRWRADAIVMGTHGRRGLNRVLLGSDAELVVRYSPVPVLLVPARGRK